MYDHNKYATATPRHRQPDDAAPHVQTPAATTPAPQPVVPVATPTPTPKPTPQPSKPVVTPSPHPVQPVKPAVIQTAQTAQTAASAPQPAKPAHANPPAPKPAVVKPQPPQNSGAAAAVNLVRERVEHVYKQSEESQVQAAREAEAKAIAVQKPDTRSKHQKYMQQLRASGKSVAEIQASWHAYYSSLNDEEKHEVWREFYSAGPKPAAKSAKVTNNIKSPAAAQKPAQAAKQAPISSQPASSRLMAHHASTERLSIAAAEEALPTDLKHQILRNIRKGTKLRPLQHLQSMLFGLACGSVAIGVVLFGFFNEVVIAPFIQPSRTVNNTPIIIGTDGVAPTNKAEVIIPKINVQIPLDYSAKSLKEEDIQRSLESGVAHYPSTPMPGQKGNAAFFGHSSNNIFNPGKYKFAFVLLREVAIGDTFYLTKDGVAYAYQVFDKKVVSPSQVGILNAIPGKTATATLITCDPPGTTTNRLVIIGEQVSPLPTANAAATATTTAAQASTAESELAGPAPSLWHRLTEWMRRN